MSSVKRVYWFDRLLKKFVSWAVTGNRFWYVLGLTLPILIFVVAGSRYAYTVYAKHTFLRPFYERVAVAQKESAAIRLPYLVKTGSFGQNTGYRRKNNTVGDCLIVSYFSPHKSGNGLACSKSFYRYYGLKSYNESAFRAVHAYMIAHGYRLASYENLELDVQEILEKNQLRGMNYEGQDGTTAAITFVPSNASWDCNGNSFCKFSHSSLASRYPGYVDVTISYAQTPY